MADILQGVMQGLDLPDPQSLVGQQQGNQALSPLQQVAAPQGRQPTESPEDKMFKEQMRLIGTDTGEEGALTKLTAARDKANKDQVDNLMQQSQYSTLDKVMAGLQHMNLGRVGPGMSSLAVGLQGTADGANAFSDLKDKYKQQALEIQAKQAEKTYADQWEQAKQARALTMAANNAKYKIQNSVSGGKVYTLYNTPNGSILLNNITGDKSLVDTNNFTAIRAQIHTDVANKARELSPDFLAAANGDQTIASSMMQSYISMQENKALHDINLPGVAQGAGAPVGSMLSGLPTATSPTVPSAQGQIAPQEPKYQGAQLPPAELAKIQAAAQNGNQEAQAILKAYSAAQQGGQLGATSQAPSAQLPDPHATVPLVHDVIKTAATQRSAVDLAAGNAKRVLDAPAAQIELVGHNAALDQMEQKVNQILDSPGLSHATGTILGRLPTMRGSTADTEADISSLAAKTGFAVLQEMRQASKTGGALGSISDAEEKLLQNALEPFADKNQTTAHLKQSLDNLKAYIAGARERAKQAYQVIYGQEVTPATAATPVAPPAPVSAKAKLKAFK